MVKVNWTNRESISFLTGVKLTGIDKPGMLGELSRIISDLHLNMKSIILEENDGYIDGEVRLYVEDVSTLNKLLVNLRNVEGIRSVIRLE
jgi:GTP pyrophosphokinase